MNIRALCAQVISLSEYRTTLFEYLKNRMTAIAPNLTAMVGELVGARLISHAGSLLNLSKCPASTVQILGAEKALFRALKTKHATPKYGLIYHASVVGQAAPKHKGKISRSLAAKCALAIRVDALGDAGEDATVGEQGRLAVEARLCQLEGKTEFAVSKLGRTAEKVNKYTPDASAGKGYNAGGDMMMDVEPAVDGKSTPSKAIENGEEGGKSDKKKKKKSKRASLNGDANGKEDGEEREVAMEETPKQKKKKEKKDKSTEKKEKKKRKRSLDASEAGQESSKKKKKVKD